MPEQFVPLKCGSCGGRLDVYDDMERFFCGYCGTEMIVERRGGTVALRVIAEAIKKVQIGTDKTAAELAIARYERELAGLLFQKAQVERGRTHPGVFALVWMLAIGGVMAGATGTTGGWLIPVIGAGGIGISLSQGKSCDTKIAALNQAINAVAGNIAEQKKIANG